MTLAVAGLSTAIQNALTSEYGTPTDASQQKKMADAMATAIINYLVANTVVSVTVAVDPGTHTGTGTGTIS